MEGHVIAILQFDSSMARTRNPRRRSGGSRYKKRTRYQRRAYRWPKGGSITTLRKAGRYYGRTGVSSIIRGVSNPFPYYRVVKHKYVEQFSLPAAAGAGLVRSYVFHANSTWDPNYTGTGHQPLYRDEMAAMYKYYIVVASSIKVTFAQTDTTQQVYGIICTQDTSLFNDPTLLSEQYGYRKNALNSNMNYPLVLRATFDARKKNNTDLKSLMADSDQLTAPGSSPDTKVGYLYHIWSGPQDPAVTLTAQKCMVEITYATVWLQPQDAIGS